MMVGECSYTFHLLTITLTLLYFNYVVSNYCYSLSYWTTVVACYDSFTSISKMWLHIIIVYPI